MNSQISWTNSRIPWTRVVELAQDVQREHAARGSVDPELSLRLARAVLQFQEQLVAGMVPGTNSRSR